MTVVYRVYNCPDNPLFEGLDLPDSNPLYESLNDFLARDFHVKGRWWTWEAVRWKDRWPDPPPEAGGLVRRFNDYPKAFHIPAFSPRAVDYLRDLLEPNGELLPVRHRNGIYYLYNCTTLVNCLDEQNSVCSYFDDGRIMSIKEFAFQHELVKDLSFFRLRPAGVMLLCTQVVAERIQKYGLNGFVLIKLWSSEEGPNGHYLDAMMKATTAAEKIKLADSPEVEVKGNTVVIRLYTAKKKATKAEVAVAELIMDEIEQRIYEPDSQAEGYYGSVEGHDVVSHEIRIFLSCPDCDQLVARLLPYLRSLPWNGRYQVVKGYGEYVETDVREEYVRLE